MPWAAGAEGRAGFQVRRDFLHLMFPSEEHDEISWGRRLHLPLQLGLSKITTADRGRHLRTTPMQHDDPKPTLSPEEALARLLRGNERFRRGESHWAGMAEESRTSLMAGQRPFATIIGCSDSRVPPELVFDTGLGELFVVRVAGNVVSGDVAGSLQYAGSHLHTPLFVVLGHEGCGAVEAALETRLRGTRHKSRIHLLVEGILPGLGDIDARLSPAARLSLAVERNVRWSMQQIAESPEGRARLAHRDISLVGGVYEMASGRVRLLDAS